MSDSGHHVTSGTGRIMIAIGFLCALGLLTQFFQEQLDDQRNPNTDPSSQTVNGITEVMLLRNGSGHYVSSGTINGLEVEFLLDTGATDVAVTASLARQAGLIFGLQGQAMTANGMVNTWNTNIARLQLGGIVLTDVAASILPDMGDETILLGMSALRRVEFSQSGNQLTLRYQQP